MTDQNHLTAYQGRQSALQVYKEFSGGLEPRNVVDDEEDVVAESEMIETLIQSQVFQGTDSEFVFKRQSSWKKFKKSVKNTLTGWKVSGHQNLETGKIEKDVPITVEDSTDPPEVPQRSRSCRIGKPKEEALSNRVLRSSLKEGKEASSGHVPRIIITKEDGKLASTTPTIQKKEIFCSSLPDVSADSATTGSNSPASAQLTRDQIRQAITETAILKLQQKGVRFEEPQHEVSQQGATEKKNHVQESLTAPLSSEAAALGAAAISADPASQHTTHLNLLKKETQSVSSPDVSRTEHTGTKLAVMKIRAAIGNMSIDPPSNSIHPLFGNEPIVVRRRLSSEETQTLKPSSELLAQRSCSVDFTPSPKDKLVFSFVDGANRIDNKTPQQTSVQRNNSLKRNSSLKRNDSLKRSESVRAKKKPKPMIWEHFDTVAHTPLQGRCKVCHMTVSCKFNTGHFVRHLQLAHKDVYLSYQNKMQSNWTRSQLERSLK